jgi:hypothetical protein
VQLFGCVVVIAAGRQIDQDTVEADPPVAVAESCSVLFATTVAVVPETTPAADTVTPIAVEFPPHPEITAVRSSTAPRLQTFMAFPPTQTTATRFCFYAGQRRLVASR